MMVNCPKCAFSQPQDQYCANCGIDMLAYKPAQKPFFQRLLSNTVFQILALVLVIGSIFTTMRVQRHRDLAARVAEIENAQSRRLTDNRAASDQPASAQTELASAAPSAPQADEARSLDSATAASSAASNNAEQAATNDAQAPGTQAGAPPAPQPAADKAPASATASAVSELRVVFAEAVLRTGVAELLSRGTDVAAYGRISSGVIADFDKIMAAARESDAIKDFDASKAQTLKLGARAPVFRGQAYQNHPFGVTVTVVPERLDESGSRIQVEVRRVLLEQDQLEDINLPVPATFNIPKGSAAFITGVLPRRPLSVHEERLLGALPLFQIMKDESYRAGQTEVVIFIAPK